MGKRAATHCMRAKVRRKLRTARPRKVGRTFHVRWRGGNVSAVSRRRCLSVCLPLFHAFCARARGGAFAVNFPLLKAFGPSTPHTAASLRSLRRPLMPSGEPPCARSLRRSLRVSRGTNPG